VIELWDFQGELVADLRSKLVAGWKAPLLVSPTGSGKTVMFAYLAGKMAARGTRAIIMAHRKELIKQISDTLADFDVPHGFITAGTKYDEDPCVHVASAFTAVRRLKSILAPDYVIVDEAHHAIAGSTWRKCIDHWRSLNPKLRIIGVTATPQRLGGEGLHSTFDSMIIGPDTRTLIDAGYLCEYKMFAPPVPLNTSSLHMRGGDYRRDEVDALVDKPKITGNAVAHYRKYLDGRPTVAFANSIAHARHVAEDFAAAGYRSASIDGAMKAEDRDEVVRDFSAGQLNVMVSCDLVSEGFDVPGMHGAIFLRPTESLALYLQQCGRVLRTFADKEHAFILDHVGNSARHGLPCDERHWTLAGSKKSKRKDPDDIAIRQCPNCGCVCAQSAMVCDECEYAFPKKVRTLAEVKGELELVKRRRQLEFKRQRAEAVDLPSLIEVGKMRGFKNPRAWAEHVLDARDRKRA
jgi:superfamily II DNA or RNA helicase